MLNDDSLHRRRTDAQSREIDVPIIARVVFHKLLRLYRGSSRPLIAQLLFMPGKTVCFIVDTITDQLLCLLFIPAAHGLGGNDLGHAPVAD
ncbi:hypothetical protein D3C81_1658710 [compost metagenome]